MSEPPSFPPSPPLDSQPPPPPDSEPPVTRWKVATVLMAALTVVLTGTVYVLMDRRVNDLEAELEATQQELEEAEEAGSDPLDDLEELLGDLGGLEGLDDLGSLDDLSDLGDLDSLLGDGLGGLGGLDPILTQCLSSGGLNLDLDGQGSIPDADVEEQVRAIREIVADERGLHAEGALDIELVSMDEVQRRAVELAEEELDAERAAAGSRLLAALGAVEPGVDLAQAQLDALDAGVGGFYNPETGELVVGSEEIGGMGAYVTSHEMVHALADASFGLPDTTALAESDGADAAYAALNAIEGDATLYGQMFVSSHLPMDELLTLGSQSVEAQRDMSGLPHVVRRELEFPYLEGMTFTCDVFLEGGWDAVDATYAELPTTTAQILFPDRYRAGEPAVDIRAPDGPRGWEEIHHDTFGAADLLFLLEAPGDDPARALDDPKNLVQAWSGGEATVWDSAGDTAVALVLAQHTDGPPLCATMTEYYQAAFPDSSRTEPTDDDGSVFTGPDQAAVITCDGDEVALGIGPDADAAQTAISATP